MLLHEWRWAIAAIRLSVGGPASSLRRAEGRGGDGAGNKAFAVVWPCAAPRFVCRLRWRLVRTGTAAAWRRCSCRRPFEAGEGCGNGDRGVGSELGRCGRHRAQRKVVARLWPAVAALHCTAIRHDALLCDGMRCAETSKATGTEQRPKEGCAVE